MYETRSQRLLWRPNGGGFRAGSHGGEYGFHVGRTFSRSCPGLLVLFGNGSENLEGCALPPQQWEAGQLSRESLGRQRTWMWSVAATISHRHGSAEQ